MEEKAINEKCNLLIGEVWCCGECNAPTGFEEHSYCRNCEKSYGSFSNSIDWCHPYAAVFIVQHCSRLYNGANWPETIELAPQPSGKWEASTGGLTASCDSFHRAYAEVLARAYDKGFRIRKPKTIVRY